MRFLVVVSVMVVAACQCETAPGLLVADPSTLTFPTTAIGETSSAEVTFGNTGGTRLSVAVSVDAPFSIAESQLDVSPGQSKVLSVQFSPSQSGRATGKLRAGELAVPLAGEGLCLSAACANRWVPAIVPKAGHAMAFDSTRGELVLCGGIDTWAWDGSRWTLRLPASSPPAVGGGAMAFDTRRERMVLFLVGQRPETWEWDGSEWAPRFPATQPDRAGSMAWDEARRRVVLFNTRNETWEYDGLEWTRRMTLQSPPFGALAFDPVRQKVILFSALSTTWEWNGSSWTQLMPPTAPPPRASSSFACDPIRRRCVIFGGTKSDSTRLADTWEWDGSNWEERPTAVAPPARTNWLAWHGPSGRVVLFGGLGLDETESTWEWDGVAWTKRDEVLVPPRRIHDTAMTWDAVRGRIVLFGGEQGPNLRGDTWEWNGSRWEDRQPALSPSPRSRHAMTFDPVRQRVVLFGGLGAGVPPAVNMALNDTWEWDGLSWTQAQPTTSPSVGGFEQDLAWDPVRQRVVLVTSAPETWEWDGTDWNQRMPTTSPPRHGSTRVAWDVARQRLVTNLGYGEATWLWDGTNWSEAPQTSARTGWSGFAYDPDRQRVMAYGGNNSNDTWEWDGTAWTQLLPITSPPVSQMPGISLRPVLAYDAIRKRMTLFDGVNTWFYVP